MQELIQVQKFSENEWLIGGVYEGNVTAKNLVIMVHDGGNDKDENGAFPVVENGLLKKDKGRVVFKEKEYGNYEILSNTLGLDDDYGVFRYDLRNYGTSRVDNCLDKRDMLYERYAKDLRDVLKYLRGKYSFTEVSFVGTGVGALVIEYYLTKYVENTIKIGKSVFICPNSPKIIANQDSKFVFSYQKRESILKNNKQFLKINGLYEGVKTVYEAENNYNLNIEYANMKIPTLFILSFDDKMYPWEILIKEIEEMRKISENICVEAIKTTGVGALHGIYDEENSYKMLESVYEFLREDKDE